MVDGSGGVVEFSGDVPGHDIVGPASGVKVVIEGKAGEGVKDV